MELSTYALMLTIGAILFSGLVFVGISYAYTSEKHQVLPSAPGAAERQADAVEVGRSDRSRNAA